MGRKKSSYDWVPDGWKVQVRVRKNGKKDKCYVDPSNKHKFFSKTQVLCYLKNVGIHQPVCEETQNKSNSRRSAVKEKVAEGLPAGWIKEIRVTQKGNKIRRDSYYIDPVSGHLFRSMKEVSRYLDTGTGRMGMPASNPNNESPINAKSRENSLLSSAETEEKKTDDSKAEKQFLGNQSPKSDTAAKHNVNLPEADKLDEREKKESSFGSTSTVTEVPIKNLQTGNSLEATKCKKRKLNDKKGADIPRRTSKRLAGIGVDISMESNDHARAHQAAGRQTSETEVNCVDKGDSSANLEEQVESVRTETEADKKQGRLDVMSPWGVISPEKHAKKPGVANCLGDEKPEAPLDVCLNDFLKDPCIEFAIKTLTDAIPVTKNQGSLSNLPESTVPSSNVDLPCEDIWSDPCFEFAVKTLTGDVDTNMEPILKQPSHSSSSGIEGESGLKLPNNMSGFSPANKHSNVAETPVDKQRF